MGIAETDPNVPIGQDAQRVRELARTLGGVSDDLKSANGEQRYRRVDQWVKQNWERFDRFSQQLKLRDMAAVAAVVFLVYFVLTILSAVCPVSVPQLDYGPTQAEVIIGLVGVFLGFSTLSIQMHSSRPSGEAAVIVPFVLKTHWLYLNWGFGLGMILVNVIALICHDVAVPWSLHGVSAGNALMSFALLFLIGRFLHVTGRDASAPNIGEFVSKFAAFELAERIERSERRSGVVRAFLEGREPIWEIWSKKKVTLKPIYPDGNEVVGLNGKMLGKFLYKVKEAGFQVNRVELDASSSNPILVVLGKLDVKENLLQQPSDRNFGSEHVEAGGPESIQSVSRIAVSKDAHPKELDQDEFEQALLRSLHFKPDDDSPGELLLRSLKHWQDALEEAVINDRAGVCERLLGDVFKVVRLVVGRDEAKALMPGRYGARDVGDPPLLLDLYTPIDLALAHETRESLLAITDYLIRVSNFGQRLDDSYAVDAALGTLQYVHYQSHPRQERGSERLYSSVEKDLDGYLHTVIGYGLYTSKSMTPADLRVLGFALQITKAAIELGEVESAKSFANRIAEPLEHNSRSHRSQAIESLESADYIVIGMVALLGWAVAMLEREENLPSRSESSWVVVDGLSEHRFEVMYLINLWELSGGIGRDSISEVNALIGNWDPDVEKEAEARPGMVKVHRVDGSWGLKGLLLLMLPRADSSMNLGRYFGDSPPPRYVWDTAHIESAFNSMEPLQLEFGTEEDRERVIEVLKARHAWGEADFSIQVAEADIQSSERYGEFLNHVRSADLYQGPGFEALRSLGVTGQSELELPDGPIRSSMGVPRDFFVKGNNWASGFGEGFRDHVINQHSMAGFWHVEQRVPELDCAMPNEAIGELIDLARDRLGNQGCKADVLLVPDFGADKLLETLFGMPSWQLENANHEWSLYLGEHDGLMVLRWPYRNAESLLIANSARLFGFTHIEDPVGVDAIDVTSETKADFIRDAQRFIGSVREGSSVSGLKQPDHRELKVRFEASVDPVFGLRDHKAGLKVVVSHLMTKN